MSNNKFKILIVEDEANILSFIKANLEISDYQVICAETCALGMMMYASYHPDLIVLDLGLPDRDGLSLIQDVREADTVPIIVLSARSGEMDKVEALDLGANDYITKPFSPSEMVARVKAHLARYDRLIGSGQKVVLGLITTKQPQLENKEAVIARIHEAAKYIPLDRLYLSPQCGFASCEIGNKLTEEEQWAKLALVKEIAEEVWG